MATQTQKQPTCADRIADHFRSRMTDLEYLYGDPDLSDPDTLRDIEGEFGFNFTWVRDWTCLSDVGDESERKECGNTWTAPEPNPGGTESRGAKCPECNSRNTKGEPAYTEESEDDIREMLYEEQANYGLCFDYCPPDDPNPDREDDGDGESEPDPGFFRYQLSWGGPADEFRFFCGPGFGCYRVEYWFLDWFDGAHRTLRGEDFKLLASVWDMFRDCGTVEQAFKDATE